MKHYRLIALSVSALGNKVLRKDDNLTYPETTWREGRAAELVKEGFLEEVVSGAPATVEPPVSAVTIQPPVVDIPATDLSAAFEVTEKKPDINELSSKDIKKLLKEKGIPFNPTASKQVLYGLL